MITKMIDRAWLSNQYRDFPLLAAALLFFIFSGIFGGGIFTGSGLVGVFFSLGRRFDGDLRVVGQAVGSLGYDALAFFQSFGDLQFVVLAYTDFDGPLMGVLVVANQHDRGTTIGCGQKR